MSIAHITKRHRNVLFTVQNSATVNQSGLNESESRASTKDMRSLLDVRCSSIKCAARSSITWFGSPPGYAAHTGQT